MGVGAHSVTWTHFYGSGMVPSCRKCQNKAKKITLRPNKNLQGQTRSKRPKKCQKCQTKISKAKRPQKRPNLTYLALRKAKWQPW